MRHRQAATRATENVAADGETIAVLGAGSWGTALAIRLARNGHRVRLWGHRHSHIEALRVARSNERYLPGIAFPSCLVPEPSLSAAMTGIKLVLLAVPSHSFSETTKRLAESLPVNAGVAWATKGLEHGTGRLLYQVSERELGRNRPMALISGPTFAGEVARGLPTAVTIASEQTGFAAHVAGLLHGPQFRAYTSSDMVGVSLGGAVKNVMAIAAGIADGLGFGANARAALITRGLAEIVRLGMATGGQKDTFMGLAGLGDLVLTCTDDQSRNRRFGLALGRGESAEKAQHSIGQVVEGTETAREVVRLAHRYRIEMPISEQVNRVVHQEQSPRRAVEELLSRGPRPETE